MFFITDFLLIINKKNEMKMFYVTMRNTYENLNKPNETLFLLPDRTLFCRIHWRSSRTVECFGKLSTILEGTDASIVEWSMLIGILKYIKKLNLGSEYFV